MNTEQIKQIQTLTQKEKVEPYVKRDTPIDGAGIKIEDNLPFS